MIHSKRNENSIICGNLTHATSISSRENHGRRADIQGLRALAVTAVVLFHAGLPIHGGFIGVDIFFVISGYVITQILIREYDQKKTIDLTAFYFRRFKRLTPALALVVFLTVTAGIILLSPLKEDVTTNAFVGIGSLAMIANAVIAVKTGGYFDVAASNTPLLHTWSLSVEEQFYLFYPLLVSQVLRIGKSATARQKTLAVAIVVLFVISILSAYAPIHSSSHAWQLVLGFYSPIARSWEFAIGAALVAFQRWIPAVDLKMRKALDIVAAAVIVMSFIFIPGSNLWPNPLTLIPVLSTAFLLMPRPDHVEGGIIAKALSFPAVVKIGDLSYSWYLWHWPFIVFTSISFGSDYRFLLLAALVSLIPAALIFILFETPIRNAKISSVRGKILFVSATLLTPISLSTFAVYANKNGYWSDEISQYKTVMDELHAGKERDCGAGRVPASVGDNACLWSNGNPNRPIYLIGDSNADHFSEAALYAGQKLNRDVRIFTKGGCAFIGDSWSDRNDLEQKLCLQYVDSTVSFLQSAPPGTVIIGISDSLWRTAGAAVGPTRRTETTDPEKTLPYLQSDLNETISEIKKGHHQILLLQPIPKFVTKENKLLFEPEKCSTVSTYLGGCPRRVEMSVSDQDAIQSDARVAIRNAAIATHSEILDMREPYCLNGKCSNYLNGKIIYKDAGHLTVSGTALSNEILLEKLKEMPFPDGGLH